MDKTRRSTSSINTAVDLIGTDPLRELFEACRNGEVSKVKKLVNPQNVNARDTAGRKSSPLHFAAGMKDALLLYFSKSINFHCAFSPLFPFQVHKLLNIFESSY